MADAPEQFPVRFGPFFLLRLLGSGGMGSAYLARHANWDSYLVVKRLHPHFMEDATVFKRFIHEAKVATYVRHNNVTPLVAMGTVGKEPFFATEFVFGIPLSLLLDRIEEKMCAPIPYALLLHLAIGVSRGLEAIHQAVDVDTGRPLELIHRDIGSRNVLLGFDGRPRIIDLGLGKSVFSDWQTAAGVFAGSPDYMPPEQALGQHVDRRGDVYALAVTIWELIVGKKRIRESTVTKRITRALEAQAEPVRIFRPEVSLQMEAALQKSMAPNPQDRLPSATALISALEWELTRVNMAVSRERIAQWLDTQCATILAKERRIMRQIDDEALNFESTAADLKLTEYLVAQPIIFMPKVVQKAESALLRPSLWTRISVGIESQWNPMRLLWRRSSRSQRTMLLVIVGVIIVLVFVITATKIERSPPGATQIEDVPVSKPRRVKVILPIPLDSQPSPIYKKSSKSKTDQKRPNLKAATRIEGSIDKQKNEFVSRVRLLRPKRFDVSWQKRLTTLSRRISAIETKQDLLSIERRLKKMESEIE